MSKYFNYILFLFPSIVGAQGLSTKAMLGEWTFIEQQDENGVKQTEIPITKFGKEAVEHVNRDSYVFKEDGEYISYNRFKTSGGTWFYDSTSQEINLELRISPDDPNLDLLKSRNLVTKRDDGFYYQTPIKKKILSITDQSMIMADREKYKLLYSKI